MHGKQFIWQGITAVMVFATFLIGQTGDISAASWWKPKPGTAWQIQYSGTLNLKLDVDVYNLDLYETGTKTIASLHQQGSRVICYFSAGSYEDWRSDARRFPKAAIGEPLDGWDGEWWLDIRNSQVRSIMQNRLDLAASKGCDGVDPDNVDGYTQDSGFPLTASHQLSYNRFLATEAHKRGLAIGLKNDLDQITQLVGSFDFAVNEQCFQYHECGLLKPFIDRDKPVFNIEYGGASTARKVCSKANSLDFDTLIKNLSLDAKRTACR